MSITSPRFTASPCMLLLPRLSDQELNPELCADHADDAACLAQGKPTGSGEDGGIINASCIMNAECTAPTPVCDRTRSRCVPCTAAESSVCRGTTSTHADGESSTCLPDGSCAAPDGKPHVFTFHT